MSWQRPAIIALLVVAVGFVLNASLAWLDLPPLRTWTGMVYALIGLAAVMILLARQAPPWMYLPLLLAFIIPQFNPDFFTLFHSFLHYSVVYECFIRGLPPENPLMAGEPLRYMFGVHAVIAWVMRLVPISPPMAFSALDGITLLAFAWICDRIACVLSPDRVYRLLSVIFALFGINIFQDGPLAGIIDALIGTRRFGAPSSLQKFTGTNTNQVGLLCFAIALLALLRMARGTGKRNLSYLMFGLATVGAAVFYQPAWIAIVAAAGTLAAAALALRVADRQRDAWMILLLLAAASAIAVPVLSSVASGTPEDPAVRLFPGLHQLRVNGKYWIVHISALLALLIWARRRVEQRLRAMPLPIAALALSVVVLHAIYLFVYVRFSNEYKFLGFASVAVAPIGAIALQALYEQRRMLAAVALFLVMIPCMTDFTWVTLAQPMTDHVVSDGRQIRHVQPDEAALYQWIWSETDRSAVFIDSLLTVPALAGRQLFVGLDIARDPEISAGRMHNGWLIDANVFQLSIISVDPEKYRLRRAQATELLTGVGPASDSLLASLRAASPAGRPLYVITRTDAQRQRLITSAGATLVYDHGGRAVFRLEA